MFYAQALRIAERTLIDGATLAERKQASKDLRALTPDSALPDPIDAKIKVNENRHRTSHSS